MKAILVRIGVDQAFGEWNAPVDPRTKHFVFVPIPETEGMPFHPGLERRYKEVMPSLAKFCEDHDLDFATDLKFPADLLHRSMHLDPDFATLTYGDQGNRRGSGMRDMIQGDLLVFFAGMRPICPCGHKLVYALIGLYVVEEVLSIHDILPDRWGENAHTRKSKRGVSDIVVRAKRGVSGRLERCIPIGEWRDRSYRVRCDLLETWGGLSVKDGFIQRSAVPPTFSDASRFLRWFQEQNPVLVERNN